MKHAILITAYKDLVFINSIIEYFDDDFDFYIHIDKKCCEDNNLIIKQRNIFVYSQYKVFWGGLNHCKAIIMLMQQALNKEKYDFFHLITGGDYPVRPLSEFKDFFQCHKGMNFLQYFTLPYSAWGSDGGMRRIQYYWSFIDTFDMRGQCDIFHRYFIRIQRKLKICRTMKFFDNTIFGGGTYWSLSNDAVTIALNYLKQNPHYLKRFKYTAIPEEIIIPNILLHHPDLVIINNALRYIDWSDHKSPRILTEDDFDVICQAKCFFARKFDRKKSKSLVELLKNRDCKC